MVIRDVSQWDGVPDIMIVADDKKTNGPPAFGRALLPGELTNASAPNTVACALHSLPQRSPANFATVTGTTTIVLTFVALGTNPASAADTPGLEYNRDVRPILAENCFACHGPDSAARKAEMRLDRRDDAMKAGAISPGNLDESELVARINAQDPKELMPPPVTTKKLTQEQKDILKRWIAGGAAYQPHWSLIPPKRPALPAVRDLAWVRNPIDRFVLTKLEEKGLHPAPEANRRTLARRLSLDLTGLPPEPAVVEAFVQDSAPDAYESLVTRFLDSPSWGEHRARYWLDYSRYADTNGYHFDNFREAWAFRDWVIGAFNRNLSFDRFTIEQLAGDLLPGSTLDQQVASGFNRCNSTTNEGGVIPEEYTVLYARSDRDGLPGVDGPHSGLCCLPRPQVRSDQPARVLRTGRILQQHDPADDGRQHQGHAADRLCPQ